MEHENCRTYREIDQFFTRYAWAVDSKDWTLYRSLFTEDAYIDYSSAPFGFAGSREPVVEWLSASLAAVPSTMHYTTNIHADVRGDSARVRAQFYNPMQLPGVEGISFCGGYYHHDLIRTPQGWRSRAMREENVWSSNMPFPPSPRPEDRP